MADTLSAYLSIAGGAVTTAAVIFLLKLLARLLPSRYQPAASPKDDHVQVLVLGDIGRSPRMQYHALSVARHGCKVDLIGYNESARHPDLINNPQVALYPLAPYPEVLRWGTLWFFVAGPLKVLWQMYTLFRVLTYTAPAAKWIIIQNPPSIPTLHIAWIVSLLRGSKLLVDWHNYGWSILATTKGPGHPFVSIYKKYETFFGRLVPTANLAVTDAMARQLREPPYGIKSPILTLHDRPAALFQPIKSAADRRSFLSKLPETKPYTDKIMAGTIRLIVSSTSWTPDEDFGLLLDALVAHAASSSEAIEKDEAATPILAIITGKGPQKAAYEQRISRLTKDGRLPGVRIVTAWLSVGDYASLLASADLGVCLHKSSSGVDLPMKVVDMFGAGLPVAAYSAYESFGELIKDGDNGCGFETAEELAAIMARLLDDSGKKELAALKKGAVKEGSLRWDEEWDRVVGKLIGV